MLLEALAGVEHRFVLRDRGDDVIALFCIRFRDAFNVQVVALGRATGKDDFAGMCADGISNLFASGLDGGLGFPSE